MGLVDSPPPADFVVTRGNVSLLTRSGLILVNGKGMFLCPLTPQLLTLLSVILSLLQFNKLLWPGACGVCPTGIVKVESNLSSLSAFGCEGFSYRYAPTLCAATEVHANTGLTFCSSQEVVYLTGDPWSMLSAVLDHKTMRVMGKHATLVNVMNPFISV